MSKLSIVLSYFLITPVIIFLALIFSLFLFYQADPTLAASFAVKSNTSEFAALPSEDNAIIQTSITTSDARQTIIEQFLQHYHSPLADYSGDIIKASDQYGLPFTLIPAIAMQESHLCQVIPDNSYNCWGYGIYTGHVTRFPDFKEGIWTVAKTLGTTYKERGLITPPQIMTMWTPTSNGSWANGVQEYMDQLR